MTNTIITIIHAAIRGLEIRFIVISLYLKNMASQTDADHGLNMGIIVNIANFLENYLKICKVCHANIAEGFLHPYSRHWLGSSVSGCAACGRARFARPQFGCSEKSPHRRSQAQKRDRTLPVIEMPE